ncbi:MAG: branched-chain amino acid transport [Betaproteobacteria bacterium]|nr:branched-chain amino acid transport [Betaproteobacteria bacterium]
MNLWLTMALAGLLTFLIRYSFIGAAGRITPPEWFRRMLRFVPIAALTALIWPDLLMPAGEWQLSFANPRLLAGLIAALVAWRSQNIFLTIAIGMGALWGLQWWL